MRWSLSILGSAALVFGIWGYANAAETTGKVVAVEGDTIRIAIESGPIPRAGDPVEVYFELEGVDAVAKVASGKVMGAEKGRVTARLDHVQGKVQQGMSGVSPRAPRTRQRGPPLPPRPRGQSSSARSTRSKRRRFTFPSIRADRPSRRRGRLLLQDPRHTRLLEIGRWQGDRRRRRPDHCATGGRIRLAGPFCENLDRHRRHSAAETAACRPQWEAGREGRNGPDRCGQSDRGPRGKVTRLQDGRVFVVD